MIAEVAPLLKDIGTIAGIVVATVAALGLLVKAKPVRWLVRRNIGDPATAWFRAQVREVVNDELDRRPLTNGWGTLAVHKIAEATGADVEPPKTVRPEGP